MTDRFRVYWNADEGLWVVNSPFFPMRGVRVKTGLTHKFAFNSWHDAMKFVDNRWGE